MRWLTSARMTLSYAILLGCCLPWHALSQGHAGVLELQVANDRYRLVGMSDRYFTNGLYASFLAPEWGAKPLLGKGRFEIRDFFLPFGSRSAQTWWGFGAEHQIFSPADIHQPLPASRDYPYAALFLFHFSQEKMQPGAWNEQQVRFGALGAIAFGEELQKLAHSIVGVAEPIGWENQLQNQAVLQGQWTTRYWINRSGSFPLIPGLYSRVDAGTLWNTAEGGLWLSLGRLPFHSFSKSGPFSVGLFAQVGARAVASNGLFRQLEDDLLRRLLLSGETSVEIQFKGITVRVFQHLQSPEFKSAYVHAWGGLALRFYGI